MSCHNFLIGKRRTSMCTENQVCFGRYTAASTRVRTYVYVPGTYTCTIMLCHSFLIGKGHTCAPRTRVFWEDTRQLVERRSECRATHAYTVATILTPLHSSTARRATMLCSYTLCREHVYHWYQQGTSRVRWLPYLWPASETHVVLSAHGTRVPRRTTCGLGGCVRTCMCTYVRPTRQHDGLTTESMN
jgi:hypothetical protein